MAPPLLVAVLLVKVELPTTKPRPPFRIAPAPSAALLFTKVELPTTKPIP